MEKKLGLWFNVRVGNVHIMSVNRFWIFELASNHYHDFNPVKVEVYQFLWWSND